jgi:hypothetical protein
MSADPQQRGVEGGVHQNVMRYNPKWRSSALSTSRTVARMESPTLSDTSPFTRPPGIRTAEEERVGSERLEAMVQAGVLSFVTIFTTALFIALARRAVNGRLQRNHWIGIRTPSTMRSNQAWVAGDRAALRLTPLFLLTNVVTCVALFAGALYVTTLGVVILVGFGVIAVIIALVVYGAFVAGNAAKSVDDDAEHR